MESARCGRRRGGIKRMETWVCAWVHMRCPGSRISIQVTVTTSHKSCPSPHTSTVVNLYSAVDIGVDQPDSISANSERNHCSNDTPPRSTDKFASGVNYLSNNLGSPLYRGGLCSESTTLVPRSPATLAQVSHADSGVWTEIS